MALRDVVARLWYVLVAGCLLASAARAGPGAHEGALEDARTAEAADEVSTAADLYATALAEEPGSRDAALGLARTLIAADRADLSTRAEAALRTRYEAANDDLDVRCALGRLFVHRALSGSDPKVCELLLARAEAHLAAVTAARPLDADAWVDRARGLDAAGHGDRAVAVLDTYLGKRPPALARALLVKGRILYEQARAQHTRDGGGFPLSGALHRLYARAHGVSLASVRADPRSFDGWMHVAWTAQVLGDREAALEGYERAYLLDPESPLPLRGVSALLAREPEVLAEVIDGFKQKDPAHRRIRLLEGYQLVQEGKWTEAVGFFEVYLDEFPDDPDAYCQLGRSHDGLGEEAKALDYYERSLALDATNVQAADGIERRLRKNALARAKKSIEEARALVTDYRRLFDLAPHNPYVRNNLAFALREGWKANQGKEGWREILLQSARFYEEGARVIGEWREEKREALPRGLRYGYAQIVCDTGIVFFTFEAIRDLERAERYFTRSLRYSDHGYLDAWSYLRQIYEKQERWDELYALADRCAASLESESGEPLAAQREAARKVADDLVAAGRVADPEGATAE